MSVNNIYIIAFIGNNYLGARTCDSGCYFTRVTQLVSSQPYTDDCCQQGKTRLTT